MCKVGIITTVHAINYGAVLQALSLKKAIEENTNLQVDIINYCGNEWITGRKIYRKNKSIKDFIVNLMCFFRMDYKKNRRKLISLFDEFKCLYLDINSRLIEKECDLIRLDGYDIYVCGSDQIWNVSLNDDPVFFLSFVNSGSKKIAYAASISERLSDEKKKIIIDRISDFDAISIREEDDAELFSKLINKNIENVLDPVFLHNSIQWKTMLSIDNDIREERYVFVFMISHNQDDQMIINKVANKRKVKVLNLHPVDFINGDEILHICSPRNFVELIAKADAVITDSFHCTAFSIIFNKEFYNIKRTTRNNRVENLYNKLNIGNRSVNVNSDNVANIEYRIVNEALENERKKAVKYITENIG